MLQRVATLLRQQAPDQSAKGLLIASGTTVPTAATSGYATGCIFQHTDGGAGTVLYVNEGSETSCSFQAISALTATQEAALPSTAQKDVLDALTSTAAELNVLDLSARTVTVAEAAKTTGITAAARIVKITGGTGFTGLVLPVPTAAELGMVKQITLDTISSSTVAMTIANIAIHGTAATTATFTNAGDTLVLIGGIYGSTYRWFVIGECGVVLS